MKKAEIRDHLRRREIFAQVKLWFDSRRVRRNIFMKFSGLQVSEVSPSLPPSSNSSPQSPTATSFVVPVDQRTQVIIKNVLDTKGNDRYEYFCKPIVYVQSLFSLLHGCSSERFGGSGQRWNSLDPAVYRYVQKPNANFFPQARRIWRLNSNIERVLSASW